MSFVRNSAWLALLVGIILSPAVVRAQVGGPLSDYLQLTVTDQNGVNVIGPLTFPFVEPPEATDPGEPPATILIPGVTVDFVELNAAGLSHISDRFQINPLQVTVISRNGPPRDNARRIPGKARERFRPISIFAFSDGNFPDPVQPSVSDSLRIFSGSFLGGPGALVFDEVIFEPTSETVPEPRINFFAPGAQFDVEEPLFETGGVPNVISDYVDHQSIQGFFLSSDNSADYANLPPIFDHHGILVENFETGGRLRYSLLFVSDVTVPEPGSFVLLSIGLLSVGLVGRGRVLRSRR